MVEAEEVDARRRALRIAMAYIWPDSFVALPLPCRHAVVGMATDLGYGIFNFTKLRRCIKVGEWQQAARELMSSTYSHQYKEHAIEIARMLEDCDEGR